MKLPVDEDMQGKALVRLLREAGHDVETVGEAYLMGMADNVVFAAARNAERALLTRNGRDFLLLHNADNEHFGILIEHQNADPAKT